ncbi:MAG: DUF2288 domain-containing protein [Sulfuricellaceae bacterium]|nr:DUF2288 domain-containing protein [Sulfuricellaceae bacterium]
MDDFLEPDELSKAKLNLETSRIAWKELLRFFAAGTVIVVSPQLDLIEVAYQIASDNQSQVAEWMQVGHIAKMPDDLAREWLEADTILWAAVVKPWVLVQQNASDIH